MERNAIIIDDNGTIRKTLKKFLHDLGFEVLSEENGKNALELIKRLKPEFVFSDMLLPGIHGIEICKAIKNDPELSKTKVIMMSSLYHRSDTISGDMRCNYDAFLEKPFGFSSIEKVIRLLTSDEVD